MKAINFGSILRQSSFLILEEIFCPVCVPMWVHTCFTGEDWRKQRLVSSVNIVKLQLKWISWIPLWRQTRKLCDKGQESDAGDPSTEKH